MVRVRVQVEGESFVERTNPPLIILSRAIGGKSVTFVSKLGCGGVSTIVYFEKYEAPERLIPELRERQGTLTLSLSLTPTPTLTLTLTPTITLTLILNPNLNLNPKP